MFENELSDLRKKNLLRTLKTRSSPQGSTIVFREREYINFSSNDYLGLACHPSVTAAAMQAIRKFGFGSGASRLLAGGTTVHHGLEKLIAGFKSAESALVFNSGYSANTGIIPAISSEKDALFSDEFNHASIIDGCRLSKAKLLVYRHGDLAHLEKLLRRSNSGRKIVLTDSVFSMDGDLAPLTGLAGLCANHDALLYIDDAHGTGVLGKGRGALAHFGLAPQPWIFEMGTFSKALGSFGSFAAGTADAIHLLVNCARSFLYSTALPACVAAASSAAVSLLLKDRSFHARLWANTKNIAERLVALGVPSVSETPIIPIMTKDVGGALELGRYLLSRGIYVPAIRPPTVKIPRVRITISAAHTMPQLDMLIESLERFRDRRKGFQLLGIR